MNKAKKHKRYPKLTVVEAVRIMGLRNPRIKMILADTYRTSRLVRRMLGLEEQG